MALLLARVPVAAGSSSALLSTGREGVGAFGKMTVT